MPELPDLQVFSRNLNQKLKGKKLLKLKLVYRKKTTAGESQLKRSTEGASLKKVYREGKELRFLFSNGTVLGLHLMLHGALHEFEKKNQNPHTILELHFHDGSGLALTDFQKAARPILNPEEKTAPDALSKEVNYRFLKTILQKKTSPVKNVLMDQNLIRGIGNAYADEILWKAGISPFSKSNKIPDEKIKLLARAIHAVLKDAEKQILKEAPGIISGEVRDFLKVHHAKKTASPGGAEIRRDKINGRPTYHTGEQILYE